MVTTTSIVIADDHYGLRKQIRNLLESTGKFTVLGEACNGVEAVTLVEKLHPHVLLLDVEMPVMGGIEVLEYLYPKKYQTKIFILSCYNDRGLMLETTSRGASGYFLKDGDPSLMLKAIQQV